MRKSFTPAYENRIIWQNNPNTSTPITADNLNKGDYALKYHDDILAELFAAAQAWPDDVRNIAEFKASVNSVLDSMRSDIAKKLDTSTYQNFMWVYNIDQRTTNSRLSSLGDLKLDKSEAAHKYVSRIAFNSNTNTIDFYSDDNTIIKSIDLYLEEIPVDFEFEGTYLKMYSKTGVLLDSVDLSGLIQVNTFEDSDTIKWIRYTTGNTVKGYIPDNSITENKLSPNFLNSCREQVIMATGQADRATEQANISTEQAAISTEAADKAERLIERITLADFYIDEDGCLICQKEYEDPSADRFSFAIINNDYLEVTVNG